MQIIFVKNTHDNDSHDMLFFSSGESSLIDTFEYAVE